MSLSDLQQLLDNRVLENEALSKHTTFKIGGPAKYFFVAKDNEDLVRAITYARKLKIPYFILGGGSNVLVSDDGFNGLIILLETKDIIINDNKIVCDAGVILMNLVNKTVEAGFLGLEWASGIPGTVGGAIRGNAGAYGGQMADNLVGVEVMRGSKQFILNKEQIKFGYRDSIFKHNNDVIITAEFKLKPIEVMVRQAHHDNSSPASDAVIPSLSRDKATFGKDLVDKIISERKEKQPLEYPSAGCIFKNIIITSELLNNLKSLDLPKEFVERGKIPAAFLIEQLDLKGYKIGGAQVSDKHANFIVNVNKATASDVIQLISAIKMKIRNDFNIQLEEEIIYVGF